MNEKYNKINIFDGLPHHYIRTDIRDLLNPALITIFDELGLTPEVFHIFGHTNNDKIANSKHLVHCDVMYDSKNNDQLTSVPFAINWELSDTSPTLVWWDVNSTPAVPPESDPELLKYDWHRFGRGEHFGERLVRITDPETECGYKKVAEYHPTKNRAFMFNTTIPHSSIWPAGCKDRICLSLRFRLEQISSWEAGYKIFKDYI